MSEPYLGQISIYGFNFPPKGFAMCNGQILSIQQNAALFSLLGTFYGGNGTTTFALPDLRGRFPLHFGQGPGLSNYSLAQVGGQETHTLITAEMPPHQHTPKYTTNANQPSPGGNVFAPDPNGNVTFATTGGEVMASTALSPAGGGQPHENRAPFLVMNFCIALVGIFPSRN